jgi:hypothetical protein
MPELIRTPSRVAAAGEPPKLIDEFVGRAGRAPRSPGRGLDHDDGRTGGHPGHEHRDRDPARRAGSPVPAVPATRPRADTAWRRYGLGLAIVRAIATAHKATITATARPEGGLDLQVSFP